MTEIFVYDLSRELVAVAAGAFDIKVDETLDATMALEFKLPTTDAANAHLIPDGMLVADGKRWIITDFDDSRADAGVRSVISEGAYIELGDHTIGRFAFQFPTTGDPLELLTATLAVPQAQPIDWTVGTAPSDGIYTLQHQDITPLALIRILAEITGLDIVWDTLAREVSLVDGRGEERGPIVRYGDNLTEIRRRTARPSLTNYRLVGRGGLRAPREEEFDYSWYVEQGLTLEDAEARFRRDIIERNDNLASVEDLQSYIERRLPEFARPKISYECTVAPSGLTGVGLGDSVGVIDDVLGVSVSTRVVRSTRFLDAPWQDKLELAYLRKGLRPETNVFGSTAAGAGDGGLRPATLVIAPYDCQDSARCDVHLDGTHDADLILAALENVVSGIPGGDILILDGTVNIDSYVYFDADETHPIEGDIYRGRVGIRCSAGTLINVTMDYGPWTLENVETETPPDGFDISDPVQVAQMERAIAAFQGHSPIMLLGASYYVDQWRWGTVDYGLDYDPQPMTMTISAAPHVEVERMDGASGVGLRVVGNLAAPTSMVGGQCFVRGSTPMGEILVEGYALVTVEQSVPLVLLISNALQVTVRDNLCGLAAVANAAYTSLCNNLLAISRVGGTGAGPYVVEISGNELGTDPAGDEEAPDPFGAALELHGITAGNVVGNHGSLDPDLTVLWIDSDCTDIILAGLNVPSGIRLLDEGTGTVDLDAGGGGAMALDDLTDVNAPAPTDLYVLTWDDGAGEWIAAPGGSGVAALDDIGDVNAPTPGDAEVLTWDDGAGEWIAAAAPGASGGLGLDSSIITGVDTLLGITSSTGVNMLAETINGGDFDFDSGVAPYPITVLTDGIYVIEAWIHLFNPDGTAYSAGLTVDLSVGIGGSDTAAVGGVGSDAFDSSSGVQGDPTVVICRWLTASTTVACRAFMDTASTFNLTDGLIHIQRIG